MTKQNFILQEFIKKQVKLIFEYNEQDNFLLNYESATKYAYENIDDVADCFDSHHKEQNIQTKFCFENYIDRIESYVDKYNKLKKENEVKIYRLVKLDSISDLDINEIGKHWSFEKSGVGSYGGMHPKRDMEKTGKPYVLTAIISPKDIDWVYGFSSFIWYGEDQWECALMPKTQVLIIKINDKTLSDPIKAQVGYH